MHDEEHLKHMTHLKQIHKYQATEYEVQKLLRHMKRMKLSEHFDHLLEKSFKEVWELVIPKSDRKP